MRTLPPNTASHHFDLLHSELLNAHLNVRPQFQSVSHESNQSFTLSSPHFDVRKVCSLPLALGGHGLLPFNLNPSPPHHSNPPTNHSQSDLDLTYHHSAFFASWSATWSLSEHGFPPSGENPFHLPPTSLIKRPTLASLQKTGSSHMALDQHSLGQATTSSPPFRPSNQFQTPLLLPPTPRWEWSLS